MTTNFVQLNTARQLGNNVNSALLQNGVVNYIPYNHTQTINADTLQLGEKVKSAEQAIADQAQKVDVKKVKKTVISAVLSVATVLGVTLAVNKNINGIWKAGEKVDAILKNSKIYNKIADFAKKVAEKNPLNKSSLWKDIKNVTSKANRIQPKNQMAKMTVLGPKGIFSLTSSDVLKGIAKNSGNKAEFTKYLEALLGKDSKICGKTISEITEACFKGGELGESFNFSNELMNTIKSKHGLKTTEDMLKFFDALKNGKIGEQTFEFAKNVKVKGWAPLTKGNLGESLKKFAIMDGQSAQTTAGKVLQQTPLILAESIGNCINDRSWFGIALGATYLPQNFTEAQEAPKGKRAKTVIAEFISSAASWAIGMATAGAAIYSAASLKNLKSTGAIASVLKKVGSVASTGLGEGSGKVSKFLGGVLRLAGVITLSGKISAPIDNVVKKSFGLPTTKEKEAAEEAKKAQEQQEIARQIMAAQQYGQLGQYTIK